MSQDLWNKPREIQQNNKYHIIALAMRENQWNNP